MEGLDGGAGRRRRWSRGAGVGDLVLFDEYSVRAAPLYRVGSLSSFAEPRRATGHVEPAQAEMWVPCVSTRRPDSHSNSRRGLASKPGITSTVRKDAELSAGLSTTTITTLISPTCALSRHHQYLGTTTRGGRLYSSLARCLSTCLSVPYLQVEVVAATYYLVLHTTAAAIECGWYQ